MIRAFLGKAHIYITAALLVAAISAGSLLIIQTMRLDKAQDRVARLQTTIKSMKIAIELTEQLVADNEAISRERDDLLRELANAESYSTPLPADIRRVLERLRREAGPAAGTP